MNWGGAVKGSAIGPLGTLYYGNVGGIRSDAKDAMERGGEYKGIDRGNFDVPQYQQQYDQYGRLAGQTRQAPQVQDNGMTAAFARANTSPARQHQAAIGKMLMQEAHGNGPAQQLARLNAEQMADRGMRQQMAMAASGRPGQSALAGRQAAMNAADLQSRAGEQGVMGGLAAQMQAQQMAGQHYQGMRGQDQGLATFNAGQRNQLNQFNAAQGNDMSRFNVDAQLRQMNLDDQRQLELLRQRLQLGQLQQQGGMGYENNRTQRYGVHMGMPTQFERELGAMQGFGNMAMSVAGKKG